MSFIAAILILNLEAADAFICFSNLLNRPCHMAFFSLNQSLVSISKKNLVREVAGATSDSIFNVNKFFEYFFLDASVL